MSAVLGAICALLIAIFFCEVTLIVGVSKLLDRFEALQEAVLKWKQ